MTSHNDKPDNSDRPADQAKTMEVDRRKALGRLGAYTAPAMVALLLSEPAAAQTGVNAD